MQSLLKTDKFIVFKTLNHLLALPIQEVLKVVKCSPQDSKMLKTMGIIQLGSQAIRIVNLPGDLPPENSKPTFLVISRNSQGELFAISVNEPPDLMELPHHSVQPLPKSNRQRQGILNMVSHAAVLAKDNTTTTIFLLDVNQIPKS